MIFKCYENIYFHYEKLTNFYFVLQIKKCVFNYCFSSSYMLEYSRYNKPLYFDKKGVKNMNSAYVYLQLYRLFDNKTPIKADCGKLCDKACCKGEDSGMYLFPGEKKVFDMLNPNWSEVDYSDFTYEYNSKTKKVPILFCNGDCDRYQRPLACRIFPLTPYLNKEKKLEIIIDPRAKSICPLAKGLDISEYDPVFLKNIHKAFNILSKNKEVYTFLDTYSRQLDEYLRFF